MRKAALAGCAVALLLAPVLTLPALAGPSPSPSPEPEDPLTVSVTELLPRAPAPGSAFEVVGAVRNTSSTLTVRTPRVRLARGDVITSRGELHQQEQDGAVFPKRFTSRPVKDDRGAVLDSLAPGAVGYFDVQTDVDSLGLTRTGVYPLDVEARGSLDDDRLQTLGAAPTWVPFFTAEAHVKRNKVAVLLPVTSPPHQAPDNSFLDDELAADLRDGPLAQLLISAGAAATPGCSTRAARRNDGAADPAPARCEPVPVTYAVDPDLVSAAVAMAGTDYRVGSGGRTDRRPGTGRAAAVAWLERLKRQAADAQGSVLALPYADPDVDALARSAPGRVAIADAVRLGNAVLADQVPGARVDAVLPPSQGSGILTKDAADALIPQSAHPIAYVLDESAFPDLEDAGRVRSPSAHVVLGPTTGDPLQALVVEDGLSSLLTGPTSQDEGSRLAEQRFIAESAIVAAEAPGVSRTFVLSPDRYTSVNGPALTEALRDVGRLPWLCPVALEPLTQPVAEGGGESCANPASPTEARRNVDRDDPRTALRQGTDAELPPGHLEQVAFQERRAVQLTDQVLTSSGERDDQAIDALQRRMRQAVARAESSAWRQDGSKQALQERLLDGALTALVKQVNVLTGRVLLTSDKGTIQVAVENTSDLPVQLRLQFSLPGRKDVETGLVTVPPKRSVPASIKVGGLRSGTFPVAVQMRDRDGKAFRGLVYVQVRSTRFGRLALGVTFAAAAVLLVAAGTRIARRALRRS